jgi:hypothetical protein
MAAFWQFRRDSGRPASGPGSAVGRELKERQVSGCDANNWNGDKDVGWRMAAYRQIFP